MSGRESKCSLVTIAEKEGRTDVANARRLVQLHGRDVRYCHPWRSWIVWDSTRWAIDSAGRAAEKAKSVSDHIWQEARDAGGGDELFKFAAQSASERSINAMLALAKSEPGITVQPTDLDRDPWLLNLRNGTIDLRTGKLREHAREDLLTKLAPVEHDPQATCEVWDRFLGRIFADDMELIRYVQRLAGYWLTGVVRDQVLPIMWGAGANGKTTFLNGITDMLGPDFGMKATSDLLMKKSRDSHPTEKADLFGKRLVVASETEDGHRLAESLVKELTGGEKIRARWLFKDHFEFDPTHKVVLASNHRPIIRGTDHAIWRRLRLVPFSVVIADSQQDKALPEKLRQESSGILNWCLDGCLDWQKHGERPPNLVCSATNSYRESQDLLAAFINERCIVADGQRTKSAELYVGYWTWCELSGEEPVGQRAFGEAMTKQPGITRKASNGIWYLGIGLQSELRADSAKSGRVEPLEPCIRKVPQCA